MATAPRLFFLDWLRILAFALLIPYHVGMVYVRWPYHLKSAQASAAIEPLMLLANPWRMSLLFVISGVATALMLARWRVDQGGAVPGHWLRQRLRRLLLPLLLGMLVIVPPQPYVEVLHQYGYSGSYLDFLRLYFSGWHGFCSAPGKCLPLPTWNHLWFLPYLAVYTALLWALLRAWPRALAATAAGLLRACGTGRWVSAVLLLVPMLWLAAVRALLKARWPTTHALVADWWMHAQYLPLFLMGAALALAPALWPRLEALRFVALALGLAAWGAMLAWGVGYSVLQWCAIVAALGFARRHLQLDGPWRRRLTGWVFPLYVVHQTVILLLGHALVDRGLPLALEATLLLLGSFVGSVLLVMVVERLPPLWPWFGFTAPRAAPPAASAAAAAA